MFNSKLKETLCNLCITATLLLSATGFSFFFHLVTQNVANVTILYILALVLIARFTTHYWPGIVASLVGVVCVNFLFTYPYYELNFSLKGYPLTFMGMLTIALITSTTTSHMKTQSRIIHEREKLLLEAEKEKMRANLLRAVSHDLRTPLTSIIGASSTYLEHESRLKPNEQLDLVQHIHEDAHWLLNMVENLLSVTRIHNNSTTVTKSLEPVEEVLSEAIFRLKKRIPDASITVKVPDELLMIPMDAMLIEQVLINLLENAIIHAHSTQPIECTVDHDMDSAIFHVRDYGIGINSEHIDHLFDGTYSLNTSSPDSKKGFGIGLSICQTIIVAHNGTLWVTPNAIGTTFSFKLPKEA